MQTFFGICPCWHRILNQLCKLIHFAQGHVATVRVSNNISRFWVQLFSRTTISDAGWRSQKRQNSRRISAHVGWLWAPHTKRSYRLLSSTGRLWMRGRSSVSTSSFGLKWFSISFSKRLLALAAQKFVSDIAADAYQHARIRTNAAGGRARAQQSFGSLSARVSLQ